MFDFLDNFEVKRLHIGLHDRDGDGNWEWTDGTPLDYETWREGFPKDRRGRHKCVTM